MNDCNAAPTGQGTGKAEDTTDRRPPTVDEPKARLAPFRSSVSTMSPEAYNAHVAAAAAAGY